MPRFGRAQPHQPQRLAAVPLSLPATAVPVAPAVNAYVNWERKPAFEDWSIGSTGLLAYWRFNETAGTVAFDRVGGNHGTYQEGATVGASGLLRDDTSTDVRLDGAIGYVSVPSTQPGGVWMGGTSADTFTLVAALQLNRTDLTQYIFAKGSPSFGLYVANGGSVVLEKMGTAAIASTVGASGLLDAGKHIVHATKAGSAVKLYVDGLDVTSSVANQSIGSSTTNLVLGQNGSSANWLGGTLGEAQLWGVALTPAQVVTQAVAFATGEFGAAIDNIGGSYVEEAEIEVGRNADFSGDKIGSANLTLDNPFDASADFFTPDRNLLTNPSFETSLDPWVTSGSANIVQAATSLSWAKDSATGGGTYSGQASLSATSNSGVYHPIEGLFPGSVPVSGRTWLRSVSGTLSVEVGLASLGTPQDQRANAGTISTLWAPYDVQWTPTADRSDAALFVRTRTPNAAVVNVDAAQVNAGVSLYPYVEAPTRPWLSAGAPLYIGTSYGSTAGPLFYGYVERITPEPDKLATKLLAYDPLKALAVKLDEAISASTARDGRAQIVDDAIYRLSQSWTNLCVNGNFAIDTTGWGGFAGNTARSTAASFTGAASLLVVGNASNNGTAAYDNGVPPEVPNFTFKSGQTYTLAFWALNRAGSTNLDVTFFQGSITRTTGVGSWPALSSSVWQRYTITAKPTADSTRAGVTFVYKDLDPTHGVYISGLMIVEGPLAPAYYVDYGSPLGRAHNYSTLKPAELGSGFSQGWSNAVGNPEAASDTSGWSTALTPSGVSGQVTRAGATLTRVSGSYQGGFTTAFSLASDGTGSGEGAWVRLPYRFSNGNTYTVYLAIDAITANQWQVSIGPNQSGADNVTTTVSTGGAQNFSITYTPNANRSNVFLAVSSIVAAPALIRFSGVQVIPGTRVGYARTGFQNPVALWDASSIATVSDGVSHPTCTQVATFAAAGSGVSLPAGTLYAVNGVTVSATLKLRVLAGTATIALGLGDPFQNLDPAGRQQVNWTNAAVTTTWQQFSVSHTASSNGLSGSPMQLFLMTPTASAVTFNIDDVAVTLGRLVQPYHVAQAAGVDKGETDILVSQAATDTAASTLLANLNSAFLGRHWIAPLGSSSSGAYVRPGWQYTVGARQKLTGLTVAESYADLAGDGIAAADGFEKDRQTILNAITASFNSASLTPGTGAAVTVTSTVAAADATSMSRNGYLPYTAGDASLVNGPTGSDTTAQDIANLLLTRYRWARSRPQITIVNHWPSQFLRQTHDLIAVSYTRERIVSQKFLILTMRLLIGDSGRSWTSAYTLEEFVPS